MWLNICQGLVLVGWILRFVTCVIRQVSGTTKTEPTGALGVFIAVIWYALSAVVIWRSGALSTILP
jgi:hypothetical protein